MREVPDKRGRPVSSRGVARERGAPHPYALAAWIIEQSDASGEPADRVMREAFRVERPDRALATRVAETVFSWYRWHPFTDASLPQPARIRGATALAARFAKEPAAIDDALLIEKAVPAWVGTQVEVTPALARALQGEPELWVRARKAHVADVEASLGRASLEAVSSMAGAFRYRGDADLFLTDAFGRGYFEIQDIASQAVGHVCAPRPGQTWWDACAGEGGKTLHLSDLMENRGVIWASDRSARRLATLRKRAARAEAFNLRIAPWPVLEKRPTKTQFHGVLVDAPCSGIGTWGRNPHARWRVNMTDVKELAAVQQQLLGAVAPNVKPGGRLIYAVCTLARDETVGVADGFEAAHPGFEPEPVYNPFAPGALFTPRQLWLPQQTGGNGMFIAAWRRKMP